MDSPGGVLLSLALNGGIPLGFAIWGIVIVFIARNPLGFTSWGIAIALTTGITFGFACWGIVSVFDCEDYAWIR